MIQTLKHLQIHLSFISDKMIKLDNNPRKYGIGSTVYQAKLITRNLCLHKII